MSRITLTLILHLSRATVKSTPFNELPETPEMQMESVIKSNHHVPSLEEDDDEMQLAIELSLEQTLAQQNIELIQTAISTAVYKYQKWYNNEQDHRGPNGFFSFFRHTEEGQLRALKFKDDILAINVEDEAIHRINSLLTYQSTRYHRHSLASFLLDELKELNNLPWHGLRPDANSNRYEQHEVLNHLAVSHSSQSAQGDPSRAR